MTELSFLIELLLNHDLPKTTKDLIASRIKEVESKLVAPMTTQVHIPMQPTTHFPPQAPSTLALMAKHGDIPKAPLEQPPVVQYEPIQVAQTPAATAALQSRNSAIAAAIDGKIDKQLGRPRKF